MPTIAAKGQEGAMSGNSYTLVSLPNEQQPAEQVRIRLRESRAFRAEDEKIESAAYRFLTEAPSSEHAVANLNVLSATHLRTPLAGMHWGHSMLGFE